MVDAIRVKSGANSRSSCRSFAANDGESKKWTTGKLACQVSRISFAWSTSRDSPPARPLANSAREGSLPPGKQRNYFAPLSGASSRRNELFRGRTSKFHRCGRREGQRERKNARGDLTTTTADELAESSEREQIRVVTTQAADDDLSKARRKFRKTSRLKSGQ